MEEWSLETKRLGRLISWKINTQADTSREVDLAYTLALKSDWWRNEKHIHPLTCNFRSLFTSRHAFATLPHSSHLTPRGSQPCLSINHMKYQLTTPLHNYVHANKTQVSINCPFSSRVHKHQSPPLPTVATMTVSCHHCQLLRHYNTLYMM